MPEPARIEDEAPPVDAYAVRRAYAVHRHQRRARLERTRAIRRARIRFWLVVLALLALFAFLSVSVWREVERLFGL